MQYTRWLLINQHVLFPLVVHRLITNGYTRHYNWLKIGVNATISLYRMSTKVKVKIILFKYSSVIRYTFFINNVISKLGIFRICLGFFFSSYNSSWCQLLLLLTLPLGLNLNTHYWILWPNKFSARIVLFCSQASKEVNNVILRTAVMSFHSVSNNSKIFL